MGKKEEEISPRSPSYDIFWKDSAGNPIWLETVSGLDHAKKRLISLRSATPGDYMIFDPASGSFLELNARQKSA